MTNAQLFFSAGFPTLAVIIGFLWQGHRFDALQRQIDGLQQQLSQMNARIGVIEGDLRQFCRQLGTHDKAIERLEARGT